MPPSNVTLRQLRAFVAVAEQASFVQAADLVLLSQPALSQSIRQLEEQVGSPLFVRTTRKVELTPLGASFLLEVKALLQQFDRMMTDVNDLVTYKHGKVSIACLPSVASRLMPRVLKVSESLHPGIRVTIRDMNMQSITSELLAGTCDLGIGGREEAGPGLRAMTIGYDRFFVLVPVSFALARHRKLQWTDLEGQPFIALSHETGIRGLVDQALETAGAKVKIFSEVTNITTLVAMVEEGLGLSALPSLLMPRASHSFLRMRPIIDPELRRALRLYWRENSGLTPAAQAVLKALIATVEKDTGALHFPGVDWDLSALRAIRFG